MRSNYNSVKVSMERVNSLGRIPCRGGGCLEGALNCLSVSSFPVIKMKLSRTTEQ